MLEVVDMKLQHVSPSVLAVSFAPVSAAACDSLECCCKAMQALPAELECEEIHGGTDGRIWHMHVGIVVWH